MTNIKFSGNAILMTSSACRLFGTTILVTNIKCGFLLAGLVLSQQRETLEMSGILVVSLEQPKSGTVPSKDGHTHYTAQFKASTPWAETSESHDSKGFFPFS